MVRAAPILSGSVAGSIPAPRFTHLNHQRSAPPWSAGFFGVLQLGEILVIRLPLVRPREFREAGRR